MILYFDGDSFIAGTELADDILPEHPGYLPFDATPHQRDVNQKWIARTYNGDLVNNRENLKDTIAILEKERAFSSKVRDGLNVRVINEALGGSSMDAITRRTISSLNKLRQQDNEVVAFIGTTDIFRTEIADKDSDWCCIQPSTSNERAKPLIDYKVFYEKNYHNLVRFYKNIITIKDFCKLNNIKVHFIETVCKPTDWIIENGYESKEDYVELKEYANLEYSLHMNQIAMDSKLPNVLCPSYHFSENIHSIVADKIIELL